MDMNKYFDNIVYVSYLTVEPTKDAINDYIEEITAKIINKNSQVWLLGRMVEFIDTKKISDKILLHHSISAVVERL
jgi:hypothetical protein